MRGVRVGISAKWVGEDDGYHRRSLLCRGCVACVWNVVMWLVCCAGVPEVDVRMIEQEHLCEASWLSAGTAHVLRVPQTSA